jgi:hypothetical protein
MCAPKLKTLIILYPPNVSTVNGSIALLDFRFLWWNREQDLGLTSWAGKANFFELLSYRITCIILFFNFALGCIGSNNSSLKIKSPCFFFLLGRFWRKNVNATRSLNHKIVIKIIGNCVVFVKSTATNDFVFLCTISDCCRFPTTYCKNFFWKFNPGTLHALFCEGTHLDTRVCL